MQLTTEEQALLDHIQVCLVLQAASRHEQQNTQRESQVRKKITWCQCCAPQMALWRPQKHTQKQVFP